MVGNSQSGRKPLGGRSKASLRLQCRTLRLSQRGSKSELLKRLATDRHNSYFSKLTKAEAVHIAANLPGSTVTRRSKKKTALASIRRILQGRHLKLSCAEMCCGIGGAALGIAQAGSEVVAALDNDALAVGVYNANHHVRAEVQDVCKADFSSLTADVVWCSCPCQPFCPIGQRRGFRDVRAAPFKRQIEIVSQVRPAVLLSENSPGLLTVRGGKDWMQWKRAIENLGYNVITLNLDAKDFGLAQSRNRLYVVASRRDLNLQVQRPPSLPSKSLASVIKKPTTRLLSRAIRAYGGGANIADSRTFAKVALDDDSVHNLSIAEMCVLQGLPKAFAFKNVSARTTIQRLIGNAVPPPVAAALMGQLSHALGAVSYIPVVPRRSTRYTSQPREGKRTIRQRPATQNASKARNSRASVR